MCLVVLALVPMLLGTSMMVHAYVIAGRARRQAPRLSGFFPDLGDNRISLTFSAWVANLTFQDLNI